MTLGELLKSSRLRLGLTLDELATVIGCSKSHSFNLEADRHEPGILMCVKLSIALGISVQTIATAALKGALQEAKNGGQS